MLEKEKFVPESREYKRVVGIFPNRENLQNTIQALKDGNFDMERVSLLARNIEDVEGAKEITEKHGNEAQEGAGIGATTGTVLGGVGGFLIGVGLLAIPGVGPILAAGAEIGALGSTLAGAGIGAATGGIVGALIGLGIPEERAKVYNERIKAGDYLLMVSGSDDKVERAASIMRDRHAEELEIFEAPEPVEHERREEVEVKQEYVEQKPVSTVKQPIVNEREVVEAHDIEGDCDPDVVIVDKRNTVR
ncbi:histidine kinase [Coleofasciculus sp. G2-EDA-02]|uniref:histidine kinase n=1 Tax=Coleofasciculus sp. G2-EDA-02 TaxID=3069529 RepID=UPI0032FA2BAD